ncbi:MAG: hypothetical protein DRJ05_14135 [Bacteroidetes bacterium]|nr:MAG: hypothetical protein DRJ05_14135 [Bacteroidota bacterium]
MWTIGLNPYRVLLGSAINIGRCPMLMLTPLWGFRSVVLNFDWAEKHPKWVKALTSDSTFDKALATCRTSDAKI